MRHDVRSFVAAAAQSFRLQGPVYEFGSYLVEGQNGLGDLRCFFPGQEYVGCDSRPGPGVDRVEDLAGLSLADGCAQTVICVDTLEHVFEVRRAAEEMIRILAPEGVLLVAAPMDFRIHNQPSDYWRMTPACVARLLAPLAAQIVGSQGVESYPHTVLGIGSKAPTSASFVRGVNRFVDSLQARLDEAAASLTWSRKWKRLLSSMFRSRGERRRVRDYYKTRFVLQMQVGPELRHEFLELHGAGTDTPKRLGPH